MRFLFIFYFLVILIAIYQDFKRREIDDWLNLFLFFAGLLFLIVRYNFLNNPLSAITLFITLFVFLRFLFQRSDKKSEKQETKWNKFFQDFAIPSIMIFLCIGFLLFVSRFITNNVVISFSVFFLFNIWWGILFYQLHIFSGGDVKLLCVFSPFLFNVFLINSIYNLAIFSFVLLLCGSIYGIMYSLILFINNFKKSKPIFIKEVKKTNNILLISLGLIFVVIGLFKNIILFLSIFIFLFVFLISFAKTMEKVCMEKLIPARNLREGDRLACDIKLGGKIFKKNWDGLCPIEVNYIKKFNKKILILDGIPYAPGFLFAIILYELRNYLPGMFF